MPAQDHRFGNLRRWFLGALIVLIAAAAAAGVWLSRAWPFTRQAITSTLEKAIGRQVEMGKFRETWFPPGCVAEDVRVPSLLTAQNLIIRTSWTGLLSHHVSKIKVVGLHVLVPASGGTGQASQGKKGFTSIGEVESNEAVLTFLPRDAGGKPKDIAVHQLVLDHLSPGATLTFHASLRTAKPQGELNAHGQAGPFNVNEMGTTPISGIYQFGHADLKVFHNLGGVLSSDGTFRGTLSQLETEGAVDIAQFHVDGSAHNSHLTGKFRASVNVHNADTVIESAEAHVGHTVILGTGNISGGHAGEGKTARLQLTVNKGRLEDLLNYFSEQKRASMSGAVRVRAYAEVPPGPGFLKKIRLDGDFGIAGGKFTNPKRQEPINHLSESAQGEKKEQQEEDPRTVVTNLKGHVVIRAGVAALKNVSFEFPGAFAEMDGTYDLIPKTVDIHGTLRTDGTLSDASSGMKALFLKVVTPFLKKSHTTVVPFKMTGKASSPSISLDLRNKIKL